MSTEELDEETQRIRGILFGKEERNHAHELSALKSRNQTLEKQVTKLITNHNKMVRHLATMVQRIDPLYVEIDALKTKLLTYIQSSDSYKKRALRAEASARELRRRRA